MDAGMLADLSSNVKRAVQNNFADVYRQRVIDMIHGQETVGAKAHSRQAANLPLEEAGFGAETLSAQDEEGDEARQREMESESGGGWYDEMEQLVSDDDDLTGADNASNQVQRPAS